MTPSFSGAHGEDVDMYVNQCEWAWAGTQMSKEDLSKAQATTLYGGLKDEALDFASGLDQETRHNFDLLSKKLKEKFHFRQRTLSKSQIAAQIAELHQESKSFDEYAEAGSRLFDTDGEALNDFLIDKWIEGLRYEPAVAPVRKLVSEWRCSGEIVMFDEVVRAARDALGRLHYTYVED
jgi:hypothetical protein